VFANKLTPFASTTKKTVSIPTIGLNSFDLAVYLNHSKKPNLKFKKAGVLISLRKIAEGEELFIDYDISFGEKHFF
jgi:SET domain-containing protein